MNEGAQIVRLFPAVVCSRRRPSPMWVIPVASAWRREALAASGLEPGLGCRLWLLLLLRLLLLLGARSSSPELL